MRGFFVSVDGTSVELNCESNCLMYTCRIASSVGGSSGNPQLQARVFITLSTKLHLEHFSVTVPRVSKF
jgi:hypothetical protein